MTEFLDNRIIEKVFDTKPKVSVKVIHILNKELIVPEVIQDIDSEKFYSGYINVGFNIGKSSLENKGYRIVSLEDYANIRLKYSKTNESVLKGCRVSEGVITLPDKKRYLTKTSPIMRDPEKFTRLSRKNDFLFLSKEELEYALQNYCEIKENNIPTNRFKESELMNFCFGTHSKEYGEYLKEHGISFLSLYYGDKLDKPYISQAWLCGLENNSLIVCDEDFLYYPQNIRGIRYK